MARETLLQANFNAGVLSPRLQGRSDFQKYGSAVARLSNAIPMVSGPATFRPGTQFIDLSGDQNNETRLINFRYSTVQAYILEFGHQFIRFFRNKSIVRSTTAITNGTFDVDLDGWTDDDTGTGVSIWSSGAMSLSGGSNGVAIRTQALAINRNISTYTLTFDVANNSVTVRIGTSSGATDIVNDQVVSVGTNRTVTFTAPPNTPTAYLQFRNPANNTVLIDNVRLDTPIYKLFSPYTQDDLAKISYAQDADVLYLTAGGNTIAPQCLKRFGHDNWQIVDMNFQDGPYEDPLSAVTLTPSAATGTVTLTASTGIFASTDVGRLVRYRTSSTANWGWAIITVYNSPTSVTAVVQSTLGGTTASTEFRLGAFSKTTGYPRVVTLHEGRLVYGNTTAHPNRIWLSEVNGFGQEKALWAPSATNGTVTDANSIYGNLTAGDVSSIVWMSSGNVLAIGTADSEWVVEASDTTKALSPTNTRITRRTNHGSIANVPAVRIDGSVLYAKQTGSRVNKFLFEFSKDAYSSVNASLLAEHLFAGKTIKSLVYAPEPFSLLWVLFTDGSLASLTFSDDQDVGGWSDHYIAGTNNTFGSGAAGMATGTLGMTYSEGTGFAAVESINVIPANDGSYSEVWMLVRRSINGSTRRYIECMAPPFFLNNQASAKYSDSFLTYEGPPVTTFSGLDHLEGERVAILVDGAAEFEQVVRGGQVHIEQPASTAVIGLPYTGEIETLDFDNPNAFGGTSMGQIRRISDVKVRLFETGILRAARAGQADDKLTLIEPREADDLQDTAPNLLTGIFPVDIEAEWDLSTRIRFQMKSPLPATICDIMIKALVNEG